MGIALLSDLERKIPQLETAVSIKRVCFYSVSTQLGGAEKSLLDLVKSLRRLEDAKVEGWILFPKSKGPFVDEVKKEGIPYAVLPMPRFFLKMSRLTPWLSLLYGILAVPKMVIYLVRWTKLMRRRKVGLIQTNGLKCHLLAALFWPFLRVPILWHLRDIYSSGGSRILLIILMRIIPVRMIANSHATARALDSTGKRITLVYNGLDPDVWSPQPNAHYREIFGVSRDVPVIGIVGVLARWKGQLQFLEMAKKLLSLKVQARFVIVGEAIYDTAGDSNFKQELLKKSQELGLSNLVHFAGFEKDSVQAINSLDVLVHASVQPEPFGRVIVEAMACGVPVVASGAGGVLEYVEDGKTGRIFPPGDVGAMADAVKELLDSQSIREEIRKNARHLFLTRFTLESHVKSLLEVYRRVFTTPS